MKLNSGLFFVLSQAVQNRVECLVVYTMHIYALI